VQRWLVLALLCVLSACFKAKSEISANNALEAQPSSESAVLLLPDNAEIVQAFERKQSDIFVEGHGTVKKLLVDDNKGSRHQKFLVTLNAQQTLLFAHNIDLAPRVDDLQVGDSIEFKGEYVYNPKGGIMHWTHHDPKGNIKGGWLKHNGKLYE
jgi:hypothetical protein